MQEEDPLYRLKLREERRIRNKIKRENKKADKLKNDVCKKSQKNNNIAIVSPGFVEEYRRKLENPEVDKITKKHPILLDIDDKIASGLGKNVIIENTEKKSKRKDEAVLQGNRLDSTQPVRCIGKHNDIQKPKKVTRLKREVILSQENTDSNTKGQFNYCDNVITENLEKHCEIFINKVVELQEKLYKRDPIKGDIKRRYFVGFHEAKKYLIVKKLKILIIAKDLKITGPNDPLNSVIKDIIKLANNSNIPYVFALKRRKIGALALKFLPMSCIGVRDYDGANEQFKAVMENILLVKPERTQPSKPDEVIQPLVQTLREELVLVIEKHHPSQEN